MGADLHGGRRPPASSGWGEPRVSPARRRVGGAASDRAARDVATARRQIVSVDITPRESARRSVRLREGSVRRSGSAANSAGPLTWRDIRAGTRRRADELLTTEAEAAALEALRAGTGETD